MLKVRRSCKLALLSFMVWGLLAPLVGGSQSLHAAPAVAARVLVVDDETTQVPCTLNGAPCRLGQVQEFWYHTEPAAQAQSTQQPSVSADAPPEMIESFIQREVRRQSARYTSLTPALHPFSYCSQYNSSDAFTMGLWQLSSTAWFGVTYAVNASSTCGKHATYSDYMATYSGAATYVYGRTYATDSAGNYDNDGFWIFSCERQPNYPQGLQRGFSQKVLGSGMYSTVRYSSGSSCTGYDFGYIINYYWSR
jgi:hypothetical protein